MKIKQLEKGPMILTGSKVLKAIMDSDTPPVDLFVREVIQNCADACKDDKEFIRINFLVNKFKTSSFCDFLPDIKEAILKFNLEDEYDYIAVCDYNTTGLLGSSVKSEYGPNNLYNLVYDIYTGKDDDDAGGSFGVGKTIYYRYGNGLCFYYTRTFEDNKYQSKLVGALIQDENKSDCFLGEKTSGIAFFGDLDNNNSCPINDENIINSFLSVFGISPYKDNETGTIIILPFLNTKEFLKQNQNDDESDTARFWLRDIKSCLKMAIQRWYFPRIDNPKYNGKYIVPFVNNERITLDTFFAVLQKLYNGDLEGANNIAVYPKKMLENIEIGYFRYKVFDKEELNVHTPPDNYPSPKYIVDSNLDCDNKGLLFYTRKPGMIINYDNQKFGTYDIVDGDKYLIGIFILNDAYEYKDENIGAYFRKTEKGNHKEWVDSKIDGFPNCYKAKPFKKICGFISEILEKEFSKKNIIENESNTNVFQQYFKKLLPPQDFGKKPSLSNNGGESSGQCSKGKKEEVYIDKNYENNNTIVYTFEFNLKKDSAFTFKINVKSNKTYSLKEWTDMSFLSPVKVLDVSIVDCFIDGEKESYNQNHLNDENFAKKRIKRVNDEHIYEVKGYLTSTNEPYELSITNLLDKVETFKVELVIEPIDTKYIVPIEAVINKGGESK